jgi:hypothetical protein
LRVFECHLDSGQTTEFTLNELHKHVKLFGFVAGYKTLEIKSQDPVNIKAAERMGKLHDTLKASGYTEHPLEVLLVRLLFCLFADDTGIFQPAKSFQAFVEERTAADGSDLGSRLAQLFQVLNTAYDKRSTVLDEQLAAFPYINGRLFAEALPMADFTATMREALLDACALDWSAISPAIFGSLFQSIMNEEARRNLGAHYTSEENILKLIKPLFLDELWLEFEKIKRNKNKLFEFHKKLRTLTFFDPACGCGNFLVIGYRELRELELAVLRASITDGQMGVDVHSLINVDVDQFYGIEIEEFPAQIAQVAMWLVDHQMNVRLSEEFGVYFARIPLSSSPHVVHGNALQLDWNSVLPAQRCSYVMGNPPFVGAKFMDDEQRKDTRAVFNGIDNAGLLDFVAAWYVKSTQYMKSLGVGGNMAPTRCAFVSTNSITQGEQVGALWGWMLAQGVHIQFAHRTFGWSNEASGKAAVHCVIVGFGLEDRSGKVIFEYEDIKGEPHAVAANNINPYLIDGPDVVLPRRSNPICGVPQIGIGNKPIDDGNYLFTPEQMRAFILAEPASEKWFRRWLGADEFLNGYERYCLWLGDCPPGELRAMPEALKRVQAVKAARLASKSPPTKRLADTPTRFHVENMPTAPYLLIPRVSSERRAFVPMGYIEPDALTSDSAHMATGISIFHFGVLSSTMHNAWVRCTCGRLESRYRYSKDIVYNNFPWPEFSAHSKPTQRAATHHPAQVAIEVAAQTVLNVRAKFQSGDQPATLADLYDPLTMPPDLNKAHQRLDAAVDKAYQASGGKKIYKSDAERVAFLFELYQKYTSLLPTSPTKTKRKGRAA